MTISERYRGLVVEVAGLQKDFQNSETEVPPRAQRLADTATEVLEEFREQVGEIPRIQLEVKLTPVLLKGHGKLDQARLLLEEQEHPMAGRVWELEQAIYRLLNDL